MSRTSQVIALAYVLGSIPSAYIFSMLFGRKNILQTGSGNVGGMNALRNVGVMAGVLTALCDLGKGALAVWIAERSMGSGWLPMAAGVAAVTGHNWMLFLGMKGGKGLGATAGALLLVSARSLGVVVMLLALLSLMLRDTNVAASVALFSLPLSLYCFGHEPLTIWLGLLLSCIVAVKHVPDFRAYLRGRRRLV